MQNFSGILLIDKPAGMSSFGVVARVRRVLSQAAGKKVKVGHTGTLDPFATGLLILVVGEYCKRAGEFSKLDKSYEATLRLGQISSTGDPEGEITPVSAHKPTKEELESALAKFRGTIEQTPPAFSAIKIGGQRAYKLAREGKEVEIPSRTVTISRLELQKYEYPDVYIVCDVSSGTYIRSLVQDIGEALDTGAYTATLRRRRVGKFLVDEATQLDTFMESEHHEPQRFIRI
ncbi:MAG: tRNA pseudouridine(55) synthase TruB [Candidatus Saccharimonadales bacterium]